VLRTPNAAYPAGTPQIQATTETGNAARFVDNGDGTYRYTFSFDIQNVTTPVAVPFEPNRTHRIALQLGSNSINNAAYDFVPAGGPVTAQREIVNNAACNACHDVMFFHGGTADGGGRRDIQYCVTCHNPGSADPESNNSVDMMLMIHKIHAGAGLTNGYFIVGWGNTLYDYSGIQWSQDIRNCGTCHQEDDATVPQASNWRKTVTAEACGSCHDDIDFPTGVGHGGITVTNNRDCQVCHGPNSTFVGGTLRAEIAHKIPAQEAAKKIRYEVLSVTNSAPGQFPVLTVRVTDPTNNNQPYDFSGPTPWTGLPGSNLRVDLAWPTVPDYTNRDGNTSNAQGQRIEVQFANNGVLSAGVTINPDGSLTRTSTVAIPASATGTGFAILEGRGVIDFNGNGVIESASERIPVTASGIYFRITGTSTVERRDVVAWTKCDDCHNPLSIHGGARTNNPELCSTCHNPVAVGRARSTDPTRPEGSIDLKVMAHAIHAGTYQVSNWGFDTGSPYPGRLNNCEGCHLTNKFYPVDATKVLGSSFRAGPSSATFSDDLAVTPNAAVCGGCHLPHDPANPKAGGLLGAIQDELAGRATSVAAAHIRQNGGSFAATRNADGTLVGPIETCALCHGPGQVSDIRVKHKIDQFVDN
jgi:OmcA/MtrC family decaheme c-type cytochrome